MAPELRFPASCLIACYLIAAPTDKPVLLLLVWVAALGTASTPVYPLQDPSPVSAVGFPALGGDSWAGRASLVPCQEEKHAVGGCYGSIQPQFLQATTRCPKAVSYTL